ncbi:Pre-mRNA-splicing factor SLU7 [Armadillidium vulgare]|nr:Pre-mRNA-splicing factor SLU7 [Armadillidium vulgare]
MRDNPYDNTGKTPEEVDYAGENFIRFTGDTVSQAKAQLFAWEAYEKGVDVSLQAEPTKLEILKKEFLKRKDEFKNKVSDDLLDKYGGKEHLEAPPKELLLAQTENYVEYSRQGKIIKGAEKEIVRSKYEEDVFPLNHASVWGSYWKDGRWGYKCCHSFIKNSYCTGEAGKETTF